MIPYGRNILCDGCDMLFWPSELHLVKVPHTIDTYESFCMYCDGIA